jgi:hypothetical protein
VGLVRNRALTKMNSSRSGRDGGWLRAYDGVHRYGQRGRVHALPGRSRLKPKAVVVGATVAAVAGAA